MFYLNYQNIDVIGTVYFYKTKSDFCRKYDQIILIRKKNPNFSHI